MSPLVDNGGHTGTRPELLSRDTSTATADGQAKKNLIWGIPHVTGNPTYDIENIFVFREIFDATHSEVSKLLCLGLQSPYSLRTINNGGNITQ